MKKIRKIVSAIILVIALIITHYTQKNSETSSVIINHSSFNYLPTSTTGQIIKHQYYSLSYSEPHEQAEWVAYELKKEDVVYTNHKRPFFIEDPKIKTKSANYRNYKKSGYDRGHLCPAGDRRFSKQAHDETFYTSNITPQNHRFNAGIWNKLEQKTRYWAKKYNSLYVVTGGILSENLPTIGHEKIAVPTHFYKILLDYTLPEIKVIAFLIPHKESKRPLYEFVVKIDELEAKTGIDFFPNLPDDLEQKLEASSNYKNWSFR
ncbi:DNA/RNA non-specific endonuclease [Tenacibaculum maritimum]|uniref:DNA/RNA non-specific endonuclease n=1 Tax=Tenacibaculum maritimum TaxID=107401 RepID=UPI0012E68C36|nr:DNA/RNA non-specific endonuclease [Tenacibaculum maritimum]CAA0171397.1 putative endonuclease [Tenacibaculum maritimum]CAA0189216.1 putative endonuclease [Tenacibaculum maritimum]CAA0208545.1 putative endonuclease [Tenacibaculum maritimum]